MSDDREIVGLADRVIRLGPLQQANSKSQVAIHPGADGHGAAWIVETLSPVPIKNIGVRLPTIAGEASRYAVFGDTQPTFGLGVNVINRFRRFAAINTTFSGKTVK